VLEKQQLTLALALVIFLLGVCSFGAGLSLVFIANDKHNTQELLAHSAKVTRRGILENGVAPIIDATARLVESVAGLVRTAYGMGAFLCLLGAVLAIGATWLATSVL
jgi:hypothetical protein